MTRPPASGNRAEKLDSPHRDVRDGAKKYGDAAREKRAGTKREKARGRDTKKGRRRRSENVTNSAIGSDKKSTRSQRPRRVRPSLARRTRWLLLSSAFITTIVLGGQWLLQQSFFRVQHVHFTGVHHESLSELLSASGLWQHPTMIGLTSSSLEYNLRNFSWIEHVDVIKQWPNTVTVEVHEGRPVAVAFNGRHILQYVDNHGRDLGRALLNANLPTLEYVKPTSITWPYERAGFNAAYVAAQLPRAFSAQVSVITVDAKGSVSLKMSTPVTFILGPPTQLNAKFVAIASVIAHSTLGPGDVVDVTVPGELAVSGPPPLSS